MVDWALEKEYSVRMGTWYEEEGYKDEPVGIYGFRCSVNGKWYIGQTWEKRGFRARSEDHFKVLRGKRSKSVKFQRAWSRHKEKNFSKMLVLEWRDRSSFSSKEQMKDWCNQQEKKWIRVKNSFRAGYNCTTGGEGYILNEEAKRHHSESQMGPKNHMYGKCGERHHGSKLTDAQRELIVQLKTEQPGVWSHSKLAKRFGVTRPCVGKILRDNGVHSRARTGAVGCKNGRSKLTDEQRREIIEFRQQNKKFWTLKRLSKKYGISISRVSKIALKEKINNGERF